MTQRRCLMAVHAHPDDEVFSTGGILAKYAAQGDRVVVVYATRGEVGEIHHPELDPDEARPRLGDIRETEAREACAVLGVTDVFFLGYRDSGMVDTEDNKNPAAFCNAPLDEAVARLLAIMRETRPDVVVTYNEEGGYGHPDHIACNRVTAAAFERAQGESWAPNKLYFTAASREGFRGYVDGLRELGLEIPWLARRDDFDFDKYGTPNAEIAAHIDVADFVAQKKKALAVHRTQIAADFFYFKIPDETLQRFAGVEYFRRISPEARLGTYEDDLFAAVADPRAAASPAAR